MPICSSYGIVTQSYHFFIVCLNLKFVLVIPQWCPPSVRNPWICPVPLFTLLLLFPFYVRNLFVLIPSFYYLSSFLVSMSSFRGVFAHRVSSQHGIHLHCIKGGQSKLIESMYGRGNIFNFFNRQRIWMLTQQEQIIQSESIFFLPISFYKL